MSDRTETPVRAYLAAPAATGPADLDRAERILTDAGYLVATATPATLDDDFFAAVSDDLDALDLADVVVAVGDCSAVLEVALAEARGVPVIGMGAVGAIDGMTTVEGHRLHCHAAEGDPGDPLTVDVATKTRACLSMTPAARRRAGRRPGGHGEAPVIPGRDGRGLGRNAELTADYSTTAREFIRHWLRHQAREASRQAA